MLAVSVFGAAILGHFCLAEVWGTHVALVDIVSPLRHQAHLDQRTAQLAVHTAVKTGGALARGAGAGYIAGDLGVDGLAEQRGGGGVNDGLKGSATVVRDHMEGTGHAAAGADLRQGVTTLGHGVLNIVKLVVSVASDAALGVAQVVVGVDVFGPEDSGLDFGDAVGTFARNDAAFDTQSGTVATQAVCLC